VVIGIAGCIFYVYSSKVRTTDAVVRCHLRIRALCFAIHSYIDEYGTPPPAVSLDAGGKPMHSWRALILPYIDEKLEYDYSVPWNHPNNSHLHDKMPIAFCCPCEAHRASSRNESSYDMIFDATKPNIDVTKMSSKNILLIETFNTGVNWLEPKSIDIAVIVQGIKRYDDWKPSLRPGSRHYYSGRMKRDNFYCVTDVGDAILLPSNTPNRLLEILAERKE
jgi:hypothetical protein